jgi:hypothetical protein
MIPNPPVFFVDGKGKPKSNEELCLQMKRMEENADSFESHIKKDHNTIQFIKAGYAGDRALGDEELARLELKREPPKGTQADLAAKASKWVKLLDGNWKEPPGTPASPPSKCGCVMPEIKLEVHHTQISEYPKGLPSKEESEAKFEVKLEPSGDERLNMFAGEHRLNREIKMTLPPTCKGKASRQERWLVYALVDSVTGSIKVRHTAFDDEPKGEIVCNQGRGTARMGIFPGHVSMVNWETVIPADSGSKTVTRNEMGTRESLTITVLEVPATE